MPTDRVVFGSKVRVLDLDLNEEEDFILVGPGEEDYDQNKILLTSPIGQGLVGKKVGDEVEVPIPAASSSSRSSRSADPTPGVMCVAHVDFERMPQHVVPGSSSAASGRDDPLPSPVGGQGRDQHQGRLEDRMADAQRPGVEGDAAGEGPRRRRRSSRPRSACLARRPGRGAGGFDRSRARAAASGSREEAGSRPGPAEPRDGDGGRPGLPRRRSGPRPDTPGGVSQSVQVPEASSVLRSDELALACHRVRPRASTMAQYSLSACRRSNCVESRRAAAGVFAQTRTPETGRSRRWTIPR